MQPTLSSQEASPPPPPWAAQATGELELTLLMPCLDEARTVGACVVKARRFLSVERIEGEVLVVDNGSRDGSRAEAERHGARVLSVTERGYGAALAAGIGAARGRLVIMGDADGSYDWSNLRPFLDELRAGADLVMGNRYRGGIQAGAMPFLHRYLGNPVLTSLGRRFFRSDCGDFYCGQRGFPRAAALKMDLRSKGMEFALEMLVKATLLEMRVVEVPITLAPDGRERSSHLRTWRDGWRSLRFLLLYSPRWLFLYPGSILMALGLGLAAWILSGAGPLESPRFDVHALLYGCVAVSIGFQLVVFYLFSKVLSVVSGLHPPSTVLAHAMGALRLEHGLVSGALLFLGGVAGSIGTALAWARGSMGTLEPLEGMRTAIPLALLITLGCQVLCCSFYFSLLKLQWLERFKHDDAAGERQWRRAA